MDLVLDKIRVWFYSCETKNMFRIRTAGNLKTDVFASTKELTKDTAWDQFLKIWDTLGEGSYEIDVKQSERAGWTTSTAVTKVTPSSNALNQAVNGIGNMDHNNTIDNRTFEFLTQELSLQRQRTELAEAKYQAEVEKRRDLERENDKLLLTKKKPKKDPMTQMAKAISKPEYVKEIMAGIGMMRGMAVPVAQIGTVTNPIPVDAKLPNGDEETENVTEKVGADAIRAQRWAMGVATSCSNIQSFTGFDIKAFLEKIEEKAAEDPQGTANMLNMAVSYI